MFVALCWFTFARKPMSVNKYFVVPPEIEGSDDITPTSVGVPANQTILLNCVIVAGNPFPTITWSNGRQLLEPR